MLKYPDASKNVTVATRCDVCGVYLYIYTHIRAYITLILVIGAVEIAFACHLSWEDFSFMILGRKNGDAEAAGGRGGSRDVTSSENPA